MHPVLLQSESRCRYANRVQCCDRIRTDPLQSYGFAARAVGCCVCRNPTLTVWTCGLNTHDYVGSTIWVHLSVRCASAGCCWLSVVCVKGTRSGGVAMRGIPSGQYHTTYPQRPSLLSCKVIKRITWPTSRDESADLMHGAIRCFRSNPGLSYHPSSRAPDARNGAEGASKR